MNAILQAAARLQADDPVNTHPRVHHTLYCNGGSINATNYVPGTKENFVLHKSTL